MTTKEKKEYAVLALLLVAIFVVVYMNFLKPKPTEVITGIPAGAVSPEGVPGTAAVTQGTTPVVSTGAFLPNGTGLNLDILDSDKFKSLTAPAYPQVNDFEIGSDNMFGK
jgi:hypothetical protein